jgi:hypothetical protein
MARLSTLGARSLLAQLAGAAAVAGGFIAGFLLLGLAPLRPQEHWPWLALFAAIVGAVPVRGVLTTILRMGLAVVVAQVASRLVTPAGLARSTDWEPWRVECYSILTFVVVLALQLNVPFAWRRPRTLLWLQVIAAIAGAGILFWSGNALFAELAAVLATMLAVVGVIDRGGIAAGGAAGVGAVLHPALLAAGVFNNFSDVPAALFAAVALFPLIPLPSANPPGRR